jgi:hypothetical protein
MTDPQNKIFIPFDASKGYPAGNGIYYECLKCSNIIPSLPTDSVSCQCGNISIDTDYGRVSVKDPEQMRIFYYDSAPTHL